MMRVLPVACGAIATMMFAVAPLHAQRTDTLALSVQNAVARALRSSDEARTAAALIDVADAQLLAARAGALPGLRLNGGYTRTFRSARGQAIGNLFAQPNTYTINANFTQPVFQGGRAFAAWRSAGRLRSAARLSAAETRDQLVIDVQRAYLGALFASRIVGIQASNLALASARESQVVQFEGAGRAARYDVLRARVERGNIEPLLVAARSNEELSLLELKRLLNIPPDQPVALTTTIDPPLVRSLFASFSADTAAVPERASVRALEFVAQARRDAIAIARADLLPTISVFAQAGYQAFPAHGFPTEAGRILTENCPAGRTTCPAGDWFADRSAGLTMSWPLFDGLRTRGAVDLAQAQLRLAELELAREREAVAIEVARARGEFARARALFEARQQNAAEADEAFRLASLRYTRGLGTQLDVSDAQLAFLTAQTDEASAIFDLYLAGAELARATGRPIPLPAPETAPPARAPTTTSGTDIDATNR